ncbi:hypothetical protein N9230_06540, partial [Akkermansiaceae bacterium]|nr:hypothetical protein [Akkermansiaceae bacterium]
MRFLLPSILILLCGSLFAKERLVLLATGLDQEKVVANAQTAVNKIAGAKVSQITAKSIAIEFDPAKVKPADLRKTLTASGLT